jgi:signal peptidase
MQREHDQRKLNVTFLVLVITAMVLPAVLTSYFGLSAHTVVSGSMEPKIQPGDVIVASQKTSADVNVGDVVIFLDRKSWQVQAHRVINKSLKGNVFTFTTKGDANTDSDGPFEIINSAALRTSSLVIPNIGYAIDSFQSNQMRLFAGFALLGIITVLIFKVQTRKPRSENSSHLLSNELNKR